MEDRYVMILGAGLMQKPAIEAAREIGLKTLVVDANPKAVCVPFADRFEPVDLKDREGLLSLARSMGKSLEGVFTAGTDFSASVSYVAEKCGLPSHSYSAACNASNKILMRKCFEKSSVPSPDFVEIHRSQIASFLDPKTLDSMKFPKVVKPSDNMGARGCRLVRCKGEFLSAIEDAVRNSRTGTAIFEDYMHGPEFSIDAVVYGGSVTITGFADRHIFYEPYFIEMGHTMPTSIDEDRRRELILTFVRGIQALGLTCGVAKADIKYTENGPMIGEIAARLSGGYMSGWTYPYASGLNLTREAMLIALGRKPEELLSRRVRLDISGSPCDIYEVPCTGTSAERAWISMPGTVCGIYGFDSCASHPFVRNCMSRTSSGDSVDFPRNNVEKCGNVIALASRREMAVLAAESAVSQLVLRLEPENPATEVFLMGMTKKSEDMFPPDAFQIDSETRKALDGYLDGAGTISEGEKTSAKIPICLQKIADNVKDWNHRSIRKTLELFDSISPDHGAVDEKLFWNALIRGGIQGVLYISDVTRKS